MVNALGIPGRWSSNKIAGVFYTDEDREQAACKLQCLWRTRHSRMLVRSLIGKAYLKEYDAYSGCFYYLNKTTGESSWEKPVNLGSTDLVSKHEEESAKKIQALYRTRQARRRIHDLVQHAFEKKLDEESGYFYYVNKRTGATTWEKPKMLGSSEIVTPRTLAKQEKRAAEQKAIADRKAKERAGRQELIQIQKQKWAKARREQEEAEKERALTELMDTVGHAVAIANKTKELNAAWMPLPKVPPNILAMTHLVSLRLVGDDLSHIPDDIGENLTNLTVLNLSSNRLQHLPDSVCNLLELRELNVMKNRLVEVPHDLGNLHHLKILELACNQLSHLPESFGRLTKVPKIILELNHLVELPESLGTLGCKLLNLNKNALTTLPKCIGEMSNLRALHVNFNQLRRLPPEIADAPKLNDLALCNNDLHELPESCCKMSALKNLWLDWNHFAGLPWTFGQLTQLQMLKMEGNPSLCYPPLNIILEGVPSVMKWCQGRVSSNVVRRRRKLLADLMDCLAIAAKYKLVDPAHFRMGAVYGDLDDHYFALSELEVLFTEILPALQRHWSSGSNSKYEISDFSYSEEQCISALELHQDANSRICEFQVDDVMFTRCDCHKDGKRRVCVPPKQGFQCMRTAVLIKDHIVMEEERKLQLLKRREAEDLEAAMELAKEDAEDWCKTQEAEDFFGEEAVEKAKKVFDEKRQAEFETKASDKAEHQRDAILQQFELRRNAARSKKETAETHLQSQHSHLKEKVREPGLPNWEREKCEEDMIDLEVQMQTLDDELEEEIKGIDEEEDEALEAWETKQEGVQYQEEGGVKSALMMKLDPKKREVVKELMGVAKRQYVEDKIEEARAEVMQQNQVMRKVMANWTGMDRKVIFDKWRDYALQSYERRRLRNMQARKRKELEHSGKHALMELARWELDKYDKGFDEFSDQPYWKHADTGKILMKEPAASDFLPEEFVLPIPKLTPREKDPLCQNKRKKKLKIQAPPDTIFD